VAPLLARRLHCESVDLDVEIERLAGRPVPTILETDGEDRFRDLESRALVEALDREGPVVLACGGGILGRIPNRDLLRARASVVWLSVEPGTAAERLGSAGQQSRPLLRGGALAERLEKLLECRAEAYADLADLVVSTEGHTPQEVAQRIAERVGRT
jgi:shikimate kinase